MCAKSSTLGSQCLDFCQTLTNKYQGFNFSLSIGNSFSFSLDTRVKNLAMMTRKKASPSTTRRNVIRKKAFLDSKNQDKTETELEIYTKSFQCNVCNFSTASRKDINIHIVKHHTTIDQIDDNLYLNSTTIEDNKPETNNEDEPEIF